MEMWRFFPDYLSSLLDDNISKCPNCWLCSFDQDIKICREGGIREVVELYEGASIHNFLWEMVEDVKNVNERMQSDGVTTDV